MSLPVPLAKVTIASGLLTVEFDAAEAASYVLHEGTYHLFDNARRVVKEAIADAASNGHAYDVIADGEE